ncbi:MAG: EAL domain-containing protein [Sulfuricurvum sp.]
METIRTIIEENRLYIHFQPILSMRGRVMFGVEALLRGSDREGSTIPPIRLFAQAAEEGAEALLDARARQLAIEAFYVLWRENPKLLLFVNIESQMIEGFGAENYLFDGLLRRLGIPYGNIVLEIKEDEVENTRRLQEFCTHYRGLGFGIALDDFGIGRSSFDRLSIVRPDIIKIDRSLVSGIEHDYIHQEIVRTICKMSANIGALALAEGVETLDEAVHSTYLGATLVQGFWFARPSQEPLSHEYAKKVEQVMSRSHQIVIEKHRQREHLRLEADNLCNDLKEALDNIENLSEWNAHVDDVIEKYSDIEAIYLINAHARQVGQTLMRCTTRVFFEPTEEGSDLSYKDYYTQARESIRGSHLTGNYVSLASGNICCTYARKIDLRGELHVLCVDFMR